MDKSSVRAEVRARRRARPEAERHAAADLLADRVLALLAENPVEVTCYRSLPTEPGTGPLLRRLIDAGHVVWLPRIEGDRLGWVRIDTDTEFRSGPMGIEEPLGPGVPEVPNVSAVLLPGLAADRNGRRLGQGGGFYDRALAAVPPRAADGPLRVLLLFDDEVLDAVPYEVHDCRVDVVVTPSGVRWPEPPVSD